MHMPRFFPGFWGLAVGVLIFIGIGVLSVEGFIRVLGFLDQHSGLIAAVGLIAAAVGLVLTASQLSLYRQELRSRASEQKRLAWETILRLLDKVQECAIEAHLSSEDHSPHLKQSEFLPPDLSARYGPAQERMMSLWFRLQSEASLMPDGTDSDQLDALIQGYQSADSRASASFLEALKKVRGPIARRAQRFF